MKSVSVGLRLRVIRRAKGLCEYCRLHQVGQEATFHIDHVIPAAVGGRSDFDNLALACVSCSLRKSDRQKADDPKTGVRTSLFDPRRHEWEDHFRWRRFFIVGRTPIGRATVEAIRFNRPQILAIRSEEAIRGRHLH